MSKKRTQNQNPETPIRLSEFVYLEYEFFSNEAKKRGLSNGQVARIVLFEALSGFDQKQETLLRRQSHIDDHFELLAKVSALAQR